MIDDLVRMYKKGAITADHLVVESLHTLDPAEPGLVLSALPHEVLDRIVAYADVYQPAAMRTNYGLQPAPDQVSAAKRWIEGHVNHAKADGRGTLNPNCAERS